MKQNELYFCAILHFRYLNPRLMGPAHDFVEQNAPKEMPKGFVSSRSFHIAPDRGMAIMWFKTQQDLDNAFPIFKDFQKKIAEMFDAKISAEKAITSPSLDMDA